MNTDAVWHRYGYECWCHGNNNCRHIILCGIDTDTEWHHYGYECRRCHSNISETAPSTKDEQRYGMTSQWRWLLMIILIRPVLSYKNIVLMMNLWCTCTLDNIYLHVQNKKTYVRSLFDGGSIFSFYTDLEIHGPCIFQNVCYKCEVLQFSNVW